MLEEGRLKLRLGPDLAEALQKLADDNGVTVEGWIRRIIIREAGIPDLNPPIKLWDGGPPREIKIYSERQDAPRSTLPHGTLLGVDED